MYVDVYVNIDVDVELLLIVSIAFIAETIHGRCFRRELRRCLLVLPVHVNVDVDVDANVSRIKPWM